MIYFFVALGTRFRIGLVFESWRWSCSSYSARWLSNSCHEESSFLLTYLIKNFGFSRKSAAAVCKRLKFQTPDKPNSVLTFFESHGFSDTQISKVVRGCPQVLGANPEKTLLPKLQFFYSKGIPPSDVARVASGYPLILATSLRNRLIPSFDFLTRLFGSETRTLSAVRRYGDILLIDPRSSAARNVELLREWGVPSTKILTLFRHHSVILKTSPDMFEGTLQEIRKLGFDPTTSKFVIAVAMLRGLTKRCWAGKVDMYHKCGWSAEEFMFAFRRHPAIMMISRDKIMAMFDFYVREIGLEPSSIAKYPEVLGLSLKNRVVPRASVVKALLSKGLLSKPFSLAAVFSVSEKLFLKRFVHGYQEVPGLMRLYREKLELAAQSGKS